jgi:hypothetical protein
VSLSLSQSLTAIKAGITASFQGLGGTEPYVYTILTSGAGGTIDPDTGIYTAPVIAQSNPRLAYDTIQVEDADLNTATARILVGTPLLLFCEIIQREMNLAEGRVFLWDQKKFQPTDSGLYVIVSELNPKPFASNVKPGSDGWSTAVQIVNMLSTLSLDIISRGPEARDRKEEIIMAFNSIYAQQQQEINSFYIGKIPPGARFSNLSIVDGAAIPYRFNISVNIQYFVTKTKSVPYFDTFEDAAVTTDS